MEKDSIFKKYIQAKVYEKKLPDFLPKDRIMSLIERMKNSSSILILGDYDADGITSTTMMKDIADNMGIKKISSHIPSRYDGYGANFDNIKDIVDNYDTIVTVDNGSHTSFAKEIEKRRNLHDKFFIIDHHPNSEISFSDNSFFINPNQKGDVSTCTGLIVNYIYKCFLAYNNKVEKIFLNADIDMKNNRFDDIATISAIADMVDLNNLYNRRQIANGFKKISENENLLYRDYKPKDSLFTFLGFNVIPLINSVGRIATTEDINSIDYRTLFFTTTNSSDFKKEKFEKEWSKLANFNKIRKQATRVYAKEILGKINIDTNQKRSMIVSFDKKAPIGINGLIAQKIAESTGVSAISVSLNPFDKGEANRIAVGSGRGEGLKYMLEEIQENNPDVNFSFGGHVEALGFQIPEKEIEKFIEIANNFKPSKKYEAGLGNGNLLSLDKKISMDDFITLAKEYKKISKDIPLGTSFYVPVEINSVNVLKSYGDSGYCNAEINDICGLAKESDIEKIFLNVSDIENEQAFVLLKLPHIDQDFSFDAKVIEKDKFEFILKNNSIYTIEKKEKREQPIVNENVKKNNDKKDEIETEQNIDDEYLKKKIRTK